MERSVFFFIDSTQRLVRNDTDSNQNPNVDKSDIKTSIDTNTNLISDSYSVDKVTTDGTNTVTNTDKFTGVRSLFNTFSSPTDSDNDNYKHEKFKLKSYNYINYRGLTGNFNPTSQSTSTSSVTQQVEADYGAIVRWTSQLNTKALVLRPSDFVYHKDFGVYPPNRLLIVRRFNEATPHDLFKMRNATPISTMVTWLKPEDEPFKIKFNEKWKVSEDSFINVINDVIGFGEVTATPSFDALSTFKQSIALQVADSLGITQGSNNPLGDPDVIHEAAIRETNYKGLECDFTITFNAEYYFQYIDGVDPTVAWEDIVANTTRMATSDSKFIVNGGFGTKVDDIVSKLEGGDIDGTMQTIIGKIQGFISSTSSDFLSNKSKDINTDAQRKEDAAKKKLEDSENKNKDSVKNSAAQDLEDVKKDKQAKEDTLKQNVSKIQSTLNNYVKTALSKYKWRLRGASGAMTGAHTAHWHVTMGNPLSPWFSCGNLYVDSMEVSFPHTEMSFSDVPMAIRVTATFKPGRRMGAQEIQQIFNSGKDRIYATAPKLQIGFIPKK